MLARRSASEVSNSNKLVFEVTQLSSEPGEDYTRTQLRLKDVKVRNVPSVRTVICFIDLTEVTGAIIEKGMEK